MAKCLVGATGGGKVTVTGLSADVLLTGNVAKVLQGAKEITNVEGKLDVLAMYGGFGNNSTAFVESVVNGVTGASGSFTFRGTPKKALVFVSRNTVSISIGGQTVSSTTVIDSFSSNSVSVRFTGSPGSGDSRVMIVVLGTE